MEQSVIRLSTLALFILAAGCEGSLDQDADEGDAKADAAVTMSNVAGVLSIDAPADGYTSFTLDVSCSYGDEGFDFGVWTRAIYSIETNLECLDCFLPPVVEVGKPVADHVISACFPSDAHQGCEPLSDATGLELSDLLKPATLEDGTQVPVSGITVMFHRVHEVWNDDIADGYGTLIPFPRIDTAYATLTVASDGAISVGSDWSFCDDALNSNDCLY